MIRVIMHGCGGKMGQVVTSLIAAEENMEIVAGIDVKAVPGCPYPVFPDLMSCDVPADVVIIREGTATGFGSVVDGGFGTHSGYGITVGNSGIDT